MDVGLLLPYFLLVLTVLEEHYAMWFTYFCIIPLMDIMFYVEIPNKSIRTEYSSKMCMWIWFPLVFYTACYTEHSYSSMISMGILYNSTLFLADALDQSDAWYDNTLGDLIGDYLGFVRFEYFLSVVRSFWFFYVMLSYDCLLWHLGSIFVGCVLYEYVSWTERRPYRVETVSHYGLSHYSMFRFHQSDAQLLPTSHMWVMFYLFFQNIDAHFKLDE